MNLYETTAEFGPQFPAWIHGGHKHQQHKTEGGSASMSMNLDDHASRQHVCKQALEATRTNDKPDAGSFNFTAAR